MKPGKATLSKGLEITPIDKRYRFLTIIAKYVQENIF
jgi:hypothetical protein